MKKKSNILDDDFYDEDDASELDNMDMPCMCDCGTWFDLNDGYPSLNSSKVICHKCHKKEEDDD